MLIDLARPDSARPDVSSRSRTSTLAVTLGLLGTLLLVGSSWWKAAQPARFDDSFTQPAFLSWFPADSALPTSAAVAGLLAVLLAWLLLGRAVLTGPCPQLRPALVLWSLPWLFALPYGTRDPWAYAAQGDIAWRGLDPYVSSPWTAGGPFTAEVTARWIDQPAPYGPLWLEFGRLVRVVCGEHGVLTMLVYRLPVLAAILTSAWLVRRLAMLVGVRPQLAVWLAVLNPLTLILGLGGIHNDLVMVALMLAGLWFAASRPQLGVAMSLAGGWCALGAAVKAPAVVAAAFAVPVWWYYAARESDRRLGRLVLACAVVAASFLTVFGLITIASGWGLGWIRQLGTDATVVNWTSLPTAAVLVHRLLAGERDTQAVTDHLRAVRDVGTGLSVVALVVGWFTALRRQPLACAGIGLLVVILFGSAVQPWYLCWALPLLALTPLPRWAVLSMATVVVAWPLWIRPNGNSAVMQPITFVYIVAAAGVAWWVLAWRRSNWTRADWRLMDWSQGGTPSDAVADDDSEYARSGVRADDRPDLRHGQDVGARPALGYRRGQLDGAVRGPEVLHGDIDR